LAKKTVVVIVGPSYAGKQFTIEQANKTAGVAKGEIFLTDLVPSKLFLGHFENGLWQ
jgi:ABC-type polar amino acid transport system ATPase subunit